MDQASEASGLAEKAFAAGEKVTGIAAISLAAQVVQLAKVMERSRMKGESRTAQIAVGDLFRDKYFDSPKRRLARGQRSEKTILVVELLPKGVRAKVVVTPWGKATDKGRVTKISFDALKAGYEKVVADAG